MGKYLLIESRDPFESTGSLDFYDLAESLAAAGHEVVLYLVQNGVLPCRAGSRFAERVSRMARVAVGGGGAEEGVTVLSDDFSLRERGIQEATPGVAISKIDALVDLLMEPGRKALWH